MLRQDLNLYRAFKAPVGPTIFLTWNYFWLSLILLSIILFLHFLYALWDLHSLKVADDAKIQQATTLESQFINLKKQFPAVIFSENAEKMVGNLKAEVELQQRLMTSARENNFFSQNMQDFSQLIVPKVWLTTFVIDGNVDTIHLKGKSIQKEDLQKFIDNLAKSPQYKTYRVTLTDATNVAKDPNKTDLEFNIDMVKQP